MTKHEEAARAFFASLTEQDPENWEIVGRPVPKVGYDFASPEDRVFGQCWTDADGKWAQEPLGKQPVILAWKGPPPPVVDREGLGRLACTTWYADDPPELSDWAWKQHQGERWCRAAEAVAHAVQGARPDGAATPTELRTALAHYGKHSDYCTAAKWAKEREGAVPSARHDACDCGLSTMIDGGPPPGQVRALVGCLGLGANVWGGGDHPGESADMASSKQGRPGVPLIEGEGRGDGR